MCINSIYIYMCIYKFNIHRYVYKFKGVCYIYTFEIINPSTISLVLFDQDSTTKNPTFSVTRGAGSSQQHGNCTKPVYYWWFRISKANHPLDGAETRDKLINYLWNPVNNGIWTTFPSTGEFTGFLVAINRRENEIANGESRRFGGFETKGGDP